MLGPFIYLFTCLFIYLFIYSFIRLFIYFFIGKFEMKHKILQLKVT